MSSAQPCPDPYGRQEIVAARLTGSGRSAVAVIGIRGPAAEQVLGRCFTPATAGRLQPGTIRFGRWHGGDSGSKSSGAETAGQEAWADESVVVTPLAEDHFEVHGHGGPAAVDRLLADLSRHGVTMVESSQWPGDAGQPLLVREAESVMCHCTTVRMAAIAADQVRGGTLRWAQAQLERLREPRDDADHTLARLRKRCHRLLRTAELGTRLAEPFRVVLAGPPNVGKSSLINSVIGYERSITFDQPGTTRDVLHAETVIGGLPIRLSDTAGIRDAEATLESEGITRARQMAETADLVIWVGDPDHRGDPPPLRGPMLRVFNKIDAVSLAAAADAITPDKLATSAVTGEGIETLNRRIADSLATTLPPPGEPVLLTRRQAECVRAAVRASAAENARAAVDELIWGCHRPT